MLILYRSLHLLISLHVSLKDFFEFPWSRSFFELEAPHLAAPVELPYAGANVRVYRFGTRADAFVVGDHSKMTSMIALALSGFAHFCKSAEI